MQTIFQNGTCNVVDEIAIERKASLTSGNQTPYYVYEIGTGKVLAKFSSNVDAINYAKFMNGDEEDEDMDAAYFDDSMDGDHQSALESVGWGMDEDYGHYGDE